MAASDARPIPRKNTAYRVTFPIWDADGDLVTGAASLDSEISIDGGTFADCTNEATEIATSSGIYFLDLTSGEMNGDTIAIIVKTGTAGAKTTPIILYPEEAGDIRVDVVQISGDATAADNLEAYTDGTTPMPVNATQLSGDATAADNAESFFDGTGYAGTGNTIPTVTTVSGLAANSVTAAAFAADAGTEIAAAVWNEDATGHQTQGSFGQVLGDSGADTDSVWGLVNTNLDATTSSRASQASVNTIDDFLDTEIAAILAAVDTEIAAIQADTDDIQTRLPAVLVGGRIDASVGAVANNAITAAAIAADVTTELRALASGTSDSGTTTTMVDAARTEADTDYWKGAFILFTSGNITGQTRLITGFDAGTDTITFAPATTQAVATQTYEILPAARADLQLWLGSVVNALVSGRVDGSVGAMAADVVTAASIAPDAIGSSELAASAVTEIQSGLATAAALDTVDNFLDTEIADIQTRLPAALVGGRMDSSIGAIAANAITAASMAADASAEIADQVWDEAIAGHLTAGSTGAALSAAGSAGDPWSTALPGAYGAGTAGKIVGDNINATISSRASQTSVDTLDDFVDTEVAAIKAKTDLIPAGGPAAATDYTAARAAKLDNLDVVLSTRATPAQVNAEVLDVINVDTFAEPGSVPAATTTLQIMLHWLYSLGRNKRTTTATADVLRNDADSATIGTSTLSDDGTTFVRGEYS